MRIRFAFVVSIAASAFASWGCSSNLGSFDVMNTDPNHVEHPLEIKRAETADQGAGVARSPAGNRIRQTTVGGTYLRRSAESADSGIKAGVHAAP